MGPPAQAPAYPPPYMYPAPYYYPPYYPGGYGPAAPPGRFEPKRLRTARAFDTGVFGLLMLGASFAWSALVAAVAAAALMPTLGGNPALGASESAWLDGLMTVRVVVWLIFVLAFLVILGALYRFHEGRDEFGTSNEHGYRDLQAGAALFLALVGGAGLLTFILSNPGAGSFNAPGTPLAALKASITLSALVWGAAGAAGALFLSAALVRMIRPYLGEESQRKLSIVPVILFFIPLLHAALSAAFLNMVEPANATWTASRIHAAAEVGGLAGALSAIPLVILVRAFREAHERIATGKVKPVEPQGQA